MESDDGFPKQDGENLIEVGDDFDSAEEEDEGQATTEAQDAMRQPMKGNMGASK